MSYFVYFLGSKLARISFTRVAISKVGQYAKHFYLEVP